MNHPPQQTEGGYVNEFIIPITLIVTACLVVLFLLAYKQQVIGYLALRKAGLDTKNVSFFSVTHTWLLGDHKQKITWRSPGEPTDGYFTCYFDPEGRLYSGPHYQSPPDTKA